MKYVLLLLLAPFSAQAAELTATVARVLDGDTFTTTAGETVRLLGINTPEPGTGTRPKEPFGPEASAIAHTLLDNQHVKLVTQAKNRDRYGRLLADVYLTDGTWVNGALLQQGAAHIYTFPDSTYHTTDLLTAEAAARAARRGLWALPRWRVKDAATCCTQKEIGEFQLVEGVVRQVVTIKGRTYLNFGTDWRTDFTVEVKKPDVPRFGDLAALQGKKVRVRGYVKPVNGALVTATHAEQIEVVARQ